MHVRHRRAFPRSTRRTSSGRVGPVWLVLGVLGALAIGLAIYLWWMKPEPPADAPTPPGPVVSERAPVASEPASAPEVVPEPPAASAPVALSEVDAAVLGLLGQQAVARFIQLDQLPQRLVATTDNLPRSQAASRLWPVQRTPGRFTTVERDGRTYIDPANAARYTPFVAFVEGIDAAAAADLYVRLLPLLQQAYAELGFPRDRFHARVMRVIDHLLAAPAPAGPIALQLTEVRGSIEPERPWVRYEYADPALEQASAGHKILVRVGAENAGRLKAWLRGLRDELQRRATEAPPPAR